MNTEDDEFRRIERENKLKSSGMGCCTYDCIQGRDCPVRKANWSNLSEKEMLLAYGWGEQEVASWQIRVAKEKILEGLRSVESAIRSKNT
jgi:hypothetical protein